MGQIPSGGSSSLLRPGQPLTVANTLLLLLHRRSAPSPSAAQLRPHFPPGYLFLSAPSSPPGDLRTFALTVPAAWRALFTFRFHVASKNPSTDQRLFFFFTGFNFCFLQSGGIRLFLKGPGSKHFRLCEPHGLCPNCSSPLLEQNSGYVPIKFYLQNSWLTELAPGLECANLGSRVSTLRADSCLVNTRLRCPQESVVK